MTFQIMPSIYPKVYDPGDRHGNNILHEGYAD